ncbi:MAG TPA: diguanylate cyclase [Solirubrobacteraceae bacterium]
MSFRARLTTFFLIIVVVPMAAMGFLVFRLISDSQQAKTEARANGIASAAVSLYNEASRSAKLDARTVAVSLAHTPVAQVRSRAAALQSEVGIERITVSVGGRSVADVGARDALAPGVATVHSSSGRPARVVALSELSASQFASQLTGRGFGVVVRQRTRTLAATLPAAVGRDLPRFGQVDLNGRTYQTVGLDLSGFGTSPVQVTVLSDNSPTDGGVATDRVVAAIFILAFLALAGGFSLMASRALHSQLADFLAAARRLARGDFSSPIPTHGNDEFAALGTEFNTMSQQLAARLEELEREQQRVRRSIRSIGDAFAANLDRDALLELALRTAMDAVAADRGRVVTAREGGPELTELMRSGRVTGLEPSIIESEQSALGGDGIGQAWTKELAIATVALGEVASGGPTHGLITVARPGSSFNEDDLELLRSLAARATLALANVNLHRDVQRQAVTDDLTGLTTHGRFQQLLGAEMEQVRRYQYPVGLVMLDIDDFKSINDVYGHQQGDVVLRSVADVLRENSRDVDVAARYGGEEMALILPHTDLDGTYVIAERVREAIEALRVPLLEGSGALQITASLGAAASINGHKDELITAADNALYVAKREGKNRTVKADGQTANVLGGR